MKNYKKYFYRRGLIHPAHVAVQIAGREIRDAASKYFCGRMLEIGCGAKEKSLLVGEFVNQHIGLDIESCQHDRSNIDVFAPAYQIPFENKSFDCILNTAVLEHLEEPEKALTEAYRVLKTGGHVLYTIPFIWHLHEEPRDFYRYSKYGIEYLFKKTGFEILELRPLAGFWITFGTELNYYLMSLARGPLCFFIKCAIAANNLLINLLNKIDVKLNKETTKWTWAYIVIARRND
jgi:SAM-dependent methyltransferase